jgi:hypothetical protein
MRTKEEILKYVNERHDYLSDHLKHLKTSKNPDNTKVELTKSYLDELETESIMDELRDLINYITKS